MSARVPKRWARRIRHALHAAADVPTDFVLRAFLIGGGYRFASPEWFAHQRIVARRLERTQPESPSYGQSGV